MSKSTSSGIVTDPGGQEGQLTSHFS